LGGEYNLAAGVDSTASGYDNYAGAGTPLRRVPIVTSSIMAVSCGRTGRCHLLLAGPIVLCLSDRRFLLYTGSGVGVQVFGGGNAWSAISDRNMKENFKPVDCRAILEKVVAMPVTTELYRNSHRVMAQDFKASFQVGEDDRHISTSDADGVALGAIQGLNQKVEDLIAELKNSRNAIEELKRRLTQLEGLVPQAQR